MWDSEGIPIGRKGDICKGSGEDEEWDADGVPIEREESI